MTSTHIKTSKLSIDQVAAPDTIGRRILDRMIELTVQPHEPGDRPVMDPHDLWRAITGDRGVSSLEIALLAENLQISVMPLLTGEPDPFEVRIIGPCVIQEGGGDEEDAADPEDQQP